jgi:hypothetical protein
VAAALVVVILLPQPGEQPVAEEPAVPEEDDFEYWNQLRRVHGWSEVAVTVSRQRHGHTPVKSRPKRSERRAVSGSGKAQGATAAAAAAAAAEVAAEVVIEGEEAVSPAKDRPKRRKRRAASSSGKAQLAAAGAVAQTAAPMERLEAAAVVARATSETDVVGGAAAPAGVRTIAIGALAAEEEMVVEARATAAVAQDELGVAAVAEEVVVEGEEGARVALARTQPQGDSATEQEPAAVIAEPAAEPAAERLRIRLAPRAVALRQHTQRLGTDAESRGQPDTLQKLDLVRSGGAVPTEHCVRAARAAQAAGAAAKLTISLLPRGAKKKRKRKRKSK